MSKSTVAEAAAVTSAEAAVEEIAEETATAEAAVEEITEEAATAEAAAQEIAEETATVEISDIDKVEEIDISMMRPVTVLANGEAGAKLFAAKDENAEPISVVSNGTVLYMADYDSVWAKVVYDNSYVYIRTVDVVMYDAENATEEEKEIFRTVYITHDLGENKQIKAGTQVTFTAHISGFENTEYTVQWSYSQDGVNFVEIEGADELTYTVSLNRQNISYTWHVEVTGADEAVND